MAFEITKIATCILFVMVMQPTAAAAKDLSASPMAAPNATVITVTTSGGQGVLIHWLQVTAVPLGVFLMGSCISGVIYSSVLWRCLTGHTEGHSSNATDQGNELRPGHMSSPLSIPGRDGSDLEEENTSSYSSEANDPADSVPSLLTMPLPPIQFPNNASNASIV